jgi:hypothetical protein
MHAGSRLGCGRNDAVYSPTGSMPRDIKMCLGSAGYANNPSFFASPFEAVNKHGLHFGTILGGGRDMRWPA